MCIFLIALLFLLITGHLAVADILPLFIILPFLIPSAVIVCGHVYAYSFQFTRDVTGLCERYETMNFYQPGYKVLDERYSVACYQIAAEELVLKLQGRLRGWYQGLSRGGIIPNSSVNSFILICLSRFLVVFLVVYLVGFAFSAALRGLVVEIVKLVFYTVAATVSGLALVLVFVLIFVSGLVGLCEGANIGLHNVIAHIAHLSFDERAPSPRACISSACGVYLAVRLVRHAATWSLRTWTAILACALVAATFIWVYPNRGRLSRCSIKMIASIGRSATDGCEMYDQEYDWPVDPTLVTPPGHGLESKEDRLPECREEVSRVAEKRPRKHVGCGRFGAGFGYVVGFRSEVHSVEHRAKPITFCGHNGLSSCAMFHPQSTCSSTPSLSALASHPIESPTTEATSEPSNLVQAEDMHPRFEQCGSLLAPVVSTSPALSTESLPDLVYNSSASSGSSSQAATPVRGSGLVALHYPITSRISSLCFSHKHVGRVQPRFSPLDAPKPVVEARTATGESKAIALLHRSEWKQKAKRQRSRNTVHGSGGSSLDLVDSPMDDVVEMVEPGAMLESVSTQQWIQAEVVVDSPFDSAMVDTSPRSLPLGSPLEDLDAQNDVVVGEPVGTRAIKPIPRLRRRMQAARSDGTDAPLVTSVVCAASLGSSTSSSPPPKSTGLEDPVSLRSGRDKLRSGSTGDSSVAPSPSSSVPITTPAAEWIRARRAGKTAAIQPVPAEDLYSNLTSLPNPTSTNGLDILAALATATRPATPVTEIQVPEDLSLAIDSSLDNDLACTTSNVPALRARHLDTAMPLSNPLDVLASLAAAAASSDATVMASKNLHANTNTKTTRTGIPKVRMVPIYTWLMDDGVKRVMKKGESIPPRANYTIKDEKGTRMMTVGLKPLRV
ncbi:hypothetical protein RhiLY_11431 [Ceratobasidium sp. AG-Ba]|nr:hypothetical protein RhiLY_11431 [Ceratobasidium sp. AG-Ba]